MEILQQINKITLEKSENLEKKLHVCQNLAKSSAFFFFFFFLHIQFTRFQTKSLQSQGSYISERTWDPSQKAITK